MTVVGIATFGDAGADSAGPQTYAAFTTEFAQQVLLPEPGGSPTSWWWPTTA